MEQLVLQLVLPWKGLGIVVVLDSCPPRPCGRAALALTSHQPPRLLLGRKQAEWLKCKKFRSANINFCTYLLRKGVAQ